MPGLYISSSEMKRVLIFIVLCALLCWFKPPTWISDAATKTHYINKTFPNQQFDIIIFGDSRTEIAISPELLEKRLGNSVQILNYAYPANGLTKDYFELGLTHLNQSSPSNQAVIVGISPASLTQNFGKNEKFKECLEYSFYDRWKFSILGEVLQLFDPIKPIDMYYSMKGLQKGRYESYGKNGWKIANKLPKDSIALIGYHKTFENNLVQEQMIADLIDFVKFMNEKSIPIFGMRIPSLIEMWNLEDSISGLSYPELIHQFENAGGIWIDIRPSEHFQSFDASHLTPKSATRFSTQLADSLNHHLSNDKTLK